jgi:hypothetical protein
MSTIIESKTAVGNTTNDILGLGGNDQFQVKNESEYPVIEFTSPQSSQVDYKGLLTVYHHTA